MNPDTKGFFARFLEDNEYPVIQASIDAFHNPKAYRYRRGELSPEAYYYDSINFDAVVNDLLQPLEPDGNRKYCCAVHDLKSDQPITVNWERASEDSILVFDGVFLQREEVRNYWDCIVLVDADFFVTVPRAVRRNFEESSDLADLEQRYRTKYVGAQERYLSSCFPKENAHLVLDNNDFTSPACTVENG
mgnify:CR=1 FL=1